MAQHKRKRPRAGKAASEQQVLYILAAVCAAIAGFIVVAIFIQMPGAPDDRSSVAQQAGTPADAGKGAMGRLVRASPPRPLGPLTFEDGEGRPRSASEWTGKVVLLNLWATWCAPCKEEMPSLERLQAKLGGPEFAVLAVSLDRSGAEAPRKFLASNNISLDFYIDKSGQLMKELRAPGLPLSVLIDQKGREIARLAGAAPWDGPEAEAIIRAAIAAKNGG